MILIRLLMDKTTFNQILELNSRFYKSVADEFSLTRQYAWNGWNKLIAEFIKLNIVTPSILDIGCGNGRFYNFLQNKGINCKYLGIDDNTELLKLAATDYPSATFESHDAIKELNKISDKFNLVVAFGLTHHIPDKAYRREWFTNILTLCEKKCMVALTFWDFLQLKEKIITDHSFHLDNDDYILGWGNKKNALRYAHYYTGDELNDISKLFKTAGFDIKLEYNSDGRNGLLNHYLVYLRP